MARIDISKGYDPQSISSAIKAIRDGYVIVAPLENGYVLLADAFFHDAVRALHVLRGDSLGTAAQVLIPAAKTLEGIAREISEDVKKLSSTFWPGLYFFNTARKFSKFVTSSPLIFVITSPAFNSSIASTMATSAIQGCLGLSLDGLSVLPCSD